MQVKHFHIRLNKQDLHKDEDAMNSFLDSVIVKKTTPQFITSGRVSYWSVLVFYEKVNIEKVKKSTFDFHDLSKAEKIRYEALRVWRADTAAKSHFPNYIVASNLQLGAIAKMNPSAINDLNKLKGFGTSRVNKYGKDIIAVLNAL